LNCELCNEAERIRQAAARSRWIVHKLHREQWQVATQIAGDYGKWLVASLTLVHGGALYGLASNTLYRPSVLGQALWWFVFGLILSLLSGFVAWINWYLLAQSASGLNAWWCAGTRQVHQLGSQA
jgi:hypothetical protein